MKKGTKYTEVSEWERYDWEGNPKPPDPPADRIEKQPGILCSEILIIIVVGIVIGLILAIITS